MKTGILVLALALAALPAHTAVFTFDSGPDLLADFNLDVRSGDSGTHWEPSYAPCNGFPGSDGGFAYFDDYASSHSIQFKAGPATLNSFQISSQRFVCGSGVAEANSAANDYLLRLYDSSGNILFEENRLIAAGGAWETLTFDMANVSTIWIASTRRDRDGTGEFGSGWWPVIDNVTVNAGNPAPVPTIGFDWILVPALASVGMLALRRRALERSAVPLSSWDGA